MTDIVGVVRRPCRGDLCRHRRLAKSDAMGGQAKSPRWSRHRLRWSEHEFAAMQLDQRPGDRQAETGALVSARQMVLDLLKRFEHLLQMVGVECRSRCR